MRVASRRTRSIILDLKKMLPAAERHWLSRELDLIDDVLGPVRNLDVFASELLPAARASLSADPALDQLASAVDAARQEAYARVRKLVQSRRYTEAVLQLLRWFEATEWRSKKSGVRSDPRLMPIAEAAPRWLNTRFRRVRKRGKGFGRATARQRHKLRIALKDLRYTSELLSSLFDPRKVRLFVKRLKTLQDSLGYANDVRVARDIVDKLSTAAGGNDVIEKAGARVVEWHERGIQKRDRKLDKRLRRLKRGVPFW